MTLKKSCCPFPVCHVNVCGGKFVLKGTTSIHLHLKDRKSPFSLLPPGTVMFRFMHIQLTFLMCIIVSDLKIIQYLTSSFCSLSCSGWCRQLLCHMHNKVDTLPPSGSARMFRGLRRKIYVDNFAE